MSGATETIKNCLKAMTPTHPTMREIPGGDALIEWFGRIPSFHDAELLDITFHSPGTGLMRLHAWNMTDQMDAEGYIVLDQHAVVTIALEGVSAINCVDLDMVPGIVFELNITKPNDAFVVEWSASYGVAGLISATKIQISLVPGKPD